MQYLPIFPHPCMPRKPLQVHVLLCALRVFPYASLSTRLSTRLFLRVSLHVSLYASPFLY
ncbi:hypothetical protein V2W45_1409029, partial [Cenococcum geophilum]